MKKSDIFYYKNNRLQQLRGFSYTVSLGSVSAAAEKMGLQQCSVSLQIKSLEQDLETLLFHRRGPRMQVSEEGLQLYELILPHIETLDSLPSIFNKKLRLKKSKSLKIAANQASVNYLLPDLIGKCKEKFPDTLVKITIKNAAEGIKLLKENKIDAYIGAIDDPTHEFIFHRIGSYEVILIAHKNHPLITSESFHLSDLSQYQTVRTPDNKFFTVPFFEEILEKYKIETYAEIEGIDWEISKAYVVSNNTFTLVSEICYDPERDYLIGKRSLKNFIPNMNYGVLTKKGQPYTEVLSLLLEYSKSMHATGYK